MKKSMFLLLLLLIPAVSALSINEVEKGSVVIAELDNPAVFDFVFNNPDGELNAELYSLVGVTMSPRGAFDIPSGTSTQEVKIYPNRNLRERPGSLTFEYNLKYGGQTVTRKLTLAIVSLRNAIEIEPNPFLPGEENITIQITNTQNTYLDDLELTFSSDFFKQQMPVSLRPFQSLNISIPVDVAKSSKLKAGPYIVVTSVTYQDASSKIESIVQYLEQQGTSINITQSGVILRKTTVEKNNLGNTVIEDSITQKRNIITRLFTTYNVEPSKIERSGPVVTYIWNEQLHPGETWSVSVTTNYTLPFAFIILIIVVVSLVNIFSQTHVKVNKTVSYVKTNTGELALKVRLTVKSKNHVDRVQLIDRMPAMSALYEKHGSKPDRIDSMTRRLFWDIPSLQAGEERVFSYIVYTKIKIVGTFELPAATVIYEKNGKTHEALSNRTFFVAETARAN